MRMHAFEGEVEHTLHRLHVSEFTEGREKFVSKLEKRQQQQQQ
jgi:hypothetical protein